MTSTVYDFVEQIPIPISEITQDMIQGTTGARFRKLCIPEDILQDSIFQKEVADKEKLETKREEEESVDRHQHQEIYQNHCNLDVNQCSIYTTQPVYMANYSDQDSFLAMGRVPKAQEKVKPIPIT